MIEAGNKRVTGSARTMPKPDGFAKADAPPARFEERHYTVAEIGQTWTLSKDVVRKLFEGEPGVMVIGDDTRKGKRRYTTIRIPPSVVERVHRRVRNPDWRG